MRKPGKKPENNTSRRSVRLAQNIQREINSRQQINLLEQSQKQQKQQEEKLLKEGKEKLIKETRRKTIEKTKVNVLRVGSNSNKEDEEEGSIVQILEDFTLNNKKLLLDPNSDDHYISNFKKFAVRIRFNRRGVKQLSRVSLVGRVPSNYYGSSEGAHIVAFGFLVFALESMLSFQDTDIAIKNLIEFTESIPDPPKFIRRDYSTVAYGEEKVFKSVKFYPETIITALENLGKRTQKNINIEDFETVLELDEDETGALVPVSKPGPFELRLKEEKFKQAVRQKLSLTRTDLAFMTSNVVRLWNQRKYTVWDGRYNEKPNSEFLNNERSFFATTLEGGEAEANSLLSLRELADKVKAGVEIKLDDLYFAFALLLDIRKEKKVREDGRQIYYKFRDAAIAEAFRLWKFAIKPKKMELDDKELIKIINARR